MKTFALFFVSLFFAAAQALGQLGVQVDTNSLLKFPAPQKFWNQNFRGLDLVLMGQTAVSNDFRFLLLTPSRALVLSTNGTVTADAAAVGSGAPVRAIGATLSNLTLSGVTVSRALLVDSNGLVVADLNPTGLGAPVRSNSPTMLTPVFSVGADLQAATNTVTHLAGWASSPVGAPGRLVAISTNALAALFASSGGGGIGGIQVNGSGTSSNAVNGTTFKFTQSSGTFSGYPTNLPASLVVSGTFDVARIPTEVLLESEASVLYASLSGNNTWTGTQLFTNDVAFSGDVSFSSVTTPSLTVGSWTVQTNLTVGGTVTAETVRETKPWKSVYMMTEMFNQNGVTLSANSAFPWGGFALASGTLVTSDIVATNHPGLTRCVSSGSANSGYGFSHRPTSMHIEDGAVFDIILRPLQSDTNTVVEAGWMNNININSPNQGLTVAFQNGYITMRSYTGTTNANFHTVSNAYTVNTFYRASLSIGSGAGREANLTVVESDTGTSILSTSWTNFPSRTVAVGSDIRAFQYTGGSSNIVDFDYIGALLPTQRY